MKIEKKNIYLPVSRFKT